jgi:hypothetical protein
MTRMALGRGSGRGLLALIMVAWLASCASPGDSLRIRGVVSAHPENDCRFAASGHVRPGLAGIAVEFTDPAAHRTFVTRIDPSSVRTTRSPCFERASFVITVPRAVRYVIQVDYYPAFGGPPSPVSVTLERLRRSGYKVNLNADPSTGE